MKRNNNTQSKHRRGRKRNTGMVQRVPLRGVPRALTPARQYLVFRYALATTLTQATQAYANISYNFSDPTNNGGTAIPGFTRYWSSTYSAALYSSFRTMDFRWRVNATNLDAAVATRVAICFTQESVTANSLSSNALQSRFVSSPHAQHRLLGIAAGPSKATQFLTRSLTQFSAIRQFIDNDTFSAYTTTGGSTVYPSTPIYGILMLLSNAAMTSGVFLDMEFEFGVEFYSQTNPT